MSVQKRREQSGTALIWPVSKSHFGQPRGYTRGTGNPKRTRTYRVGDDNNDDEW
jgi:hypothetical protein